MQTFIANLKRAIRDNEHVSIGGGVFNPAELREVLASLEASPTSYKRVKDALGNLVQWAIGNRGPKDGNPYINKPEIKEALQALHFARTGQDTENFAEYCDDADPWKTSQQRGGV